MLDAEHIAGLVSIYGYWVIAGFIAIETMGIPFPGETTLVVAAVYAGATGRLSIAGVILAAAAGAILGDNVGYWAGRTGGYPLARRYGPYIGLDERKLKFGQDIFRVHGAKVVFIGRFIAILRTWSAFFAGAKSINNSAFTLQFIRSDENYPWVPVLYPLGIVRKRLAANFIPGHD